ncbi:N-acetylglucosaminyl phosphatidylinositol deacetylase-related protein [Kipferlia bialata]|uniref:N-acetylglucosaminylphosphatidylinositol deacetylase n=1 Tax=Kipferlia bialata TaxID=797122 RepID=A0A9K3D5I9_9EUKA|nr:N-acetylglucosaminyl phosphatidylinositol deacetylase-related protein [Kipferlia bialata]|eukprot:g10296.t1
MPPASTVLQVTRGDHEIAGVYTVPSPPMSMTVPPSPSPSPSLAPSPCTLFVVAHPDDESLFFGPAILTCLNPHILCLSDGDWVSREEGLVRREEFICACHALGAVPHLSTSRGEGGERDVPGDCPDTCCQFPSLPDGPIYRWNPDTVADMVQGVIDGINRSHTSPPVHVTSVITFDSIGMSGHTNHVAVHGGVQRLMERQREKGGREPRLGVRSYSVESDEPDREMEGYVERQRLLATDVRERVSVVSPSTGEVPIVFYTVTSPRSLYKYLPYYVSRGYWHRKGPVVGDATNTSAEVHLRGWADHVPDSFTCVTPIAMSLRGFRCHVSQRRWYRTLFCLLSPTLSVVHVTTMQGK